MRKKLFEQALERKTEHERYLKAQEERRENFLIAQERRKQADAQRDKKNRERQLRQQLTDTAKKLKEDEIKLAKLRWAAAAAQKAHKTKREKETQEIEQLTWRTQVETFQSNLSEASFDDTCTSCFESELETEPLELAQPVNLARTGDPPIRAPFQKVCPSPKSLQPTEKRRGKENSFRHQRSHSVRPTSYT